MITPRDHVSHNPITMKLEVQVDDLCHQSFATEIFSYQGNYNFGNDTFKIERGCPKKVFKEKINKSQQVKPLKGGAAIGQIKQPKQ